MKPGYKQTEVGVIPEEWDAVALGDFISLQRGHDLTWRDRKEGEVPVMGSAGQNGFHNLAISKGPGVVLGRSGASFGQAHYCEQDFWPHNTALYVTDFQGNDRLFVFYFLRSIDFSRHNSGGAQQSLNRNFIAPIKVGVPRPPEQRAIATALSDVDGLLGGLDRLIAKKRDLKQAAMQQLLTGQTRLPGFHGEWEVKRLGEVATLHRLNVVPASWPSQTFVHFSLPAFDAGKAPVVELGSAIGSNKFRVPQGAVLVSKLNPRIPRVWAPDDIPEESIASTEFLVRNVSTSLRPFFCKGTNNLGAPLFSVNDCPGFQSGFTRIGPSGASCETP